MPLTPMITSTTTTTSSRTARLEDWKTAQIAVCGALCVGLLGLAGLWIKKHNDRKYVPSISDVEGYAANSSVWAHRPRPIVKPVQVEPVKAPQQPTPGEWMEMVSLLRELSKKLVSVKLGY